MCKLLTFTKTSGSNYLLEAANTADGRIVYDPQEREIFNEYHHKDHLGNIRLAFTDRNADGKVELLGDSSEITQQNDFYPFGMKHQEDGLFHMGAGGNPYRYNGIEHVEELGLYMAMFRSYDAAIGKWVLVDPLAETMSSWSPYNYTLGNPLRYTDPDGRSPDDIILGTSGDPNTVNEFLNIITESLGGQFRAVTEQVTGADGNVIEGRERVRIIATEGGGDVSKLSSGQKAFYKNINQVAEVDRREVHIDPVSGVDGVEVGLYASYPAQLDVADVRAFPALDASVDSQNGATQSGKMIHEVMEQFFKQVVDGNRGANQKGFYPNHFGGAATNYDRRGNGGATGIEDAVNRNTRFTDFRYLKPNGDVYKSKYGSTPTIRVSTTKVQ